MKYGLVVLANTGPALAVAGTGPFITSDSHYEQPLVVPQLPQT